MTVEQIVEIPAEDEDIRAMLETYYYTAQTIEDALSQEAADPACKPFSQIIGSCPGFFGGDGVAYQRKIRDEWND